MELGRFGVTTGFLEVESEASDVTDVVTEVRRRTCPCNGIPTIDSRFNKNSAVRRKARFTFWMMAQLRRALRLGVMSWETRRLREREHLPRGQHADVNSFAPEPAFVV